ncbi:N-acetyl-gamma-glutamyl-phosphate reductase [Wenxinia saemankumensis]|uniref:N-acetyl-gamma-glutamyl-phosphate reductase n=1 Tax=Wenxinia saemankumensis TaxID=1447782 RepID=A0A1M6D309_9RHOB|nr:N-acetyl-gamma-glutamyl-phosphate reductase [Wenxinia saemankumensis]SHI67569.1 N-acetyl-gamma-glutamyl-phosphate reductase [Wenxinia saemankumensis]
MTHNVAILGASGYTGAELVRIIATHPSLRIAALAADRKAGQPMASVFPHLRHLDLPDLVQAGEIDYSGIDLVFAALPHGLSQALVATLPRGIRVVDLGADFRLTPDGYRTWYGADHVAPELQGEAVYGLTEFNRDAIRGARLVAGTGCNAATVQFALTPLIGSGLIDLDDIICDLKNGVSGAGRSLKETMLFAERANDVAGYSQGGRHRHLGEFDEQFSRIAGRDVRIQFTPHLVPVNRGILASCYLKGEAWAVHDALAAAYADEPFLQVLPLGELPQMAHVQGSNFCHVGVTGDRISGRTLVVSTLDNLCKGSSGQAVQNANLMLGEDESAGLMLAPLFP